MHEHWLNKKKRSQGMSNSQIDEWYELGRKNGAIGGKLVGAGGGGFLHVLHGGPYAAAARHGQGGPFRGALPVRFRRNKGHPVSA